MDNSSCLGFSGDGAPDGPVRRHRAVPVGPRRRARERASSAPDLSVPPSSVGAMMTSTTTDGARAARAAGSRTVAGAAHRLDEMIARLAGGPGDPTHQRLAPRHWLRATGTGQGPALVELLGEGPDVRVRAWGPGGSWVLDQVPRLLGCHDDPSGFGALAARSPVLAAAHAAHRWLRIGATDNLAEALAPAVIEQKVTGPEALGGLHRIVVRHGRVPPLPAGPLGAPAARMRVPPSAREWCRVPSFEFTRAGVDARRAGALRAAMSRCASLDRALTRADDGDGRSVLLQAVPGIGPWTAARVLQRAWGDPDAWSVGDFHVPRLMAVALTGARGGDEDAERALAPYRPHRYRVELLLAPATARADRRGARLGLPGHVPGIDPGARRSSRGRPSRGRW